MTHDELVQAAAKWLRNRCQLPHRFEGRVWREARTVRCAVVFTELVAAAEIPDAIGFADGGRTSILVECKASLSDLRKDAKKFFRQRPSMGMGAYRYFLFPRGMVSRNFKLPDSWGVIEREARRTVLVRLAQRQPERAEHRERDLLWSACRRYQLAGAELNRS